MGGGPGARVLRGGSRVHQAPRSPTHTPSLPPSNPYLYRSQKLLLHESAVLFHGIGPAHRCRPVNAGCLRVILSV